ncbi:MAG TPA: M48 family metalloprotease [Gemmatimonadaceae bacterium]|nr:M48 family metalloprotease [Gemmatimonadaceae bacterium]
MRASANVRSGLVHLTAILALAGCARNPATGERELSLVSESQEIAMGQEGKQAVRGSMGLVDNAALQSYVSQLGLAMAKDTERPGLPWSYAVVDDPVVNAFALPGGPVYITRGILAYFNSEAELMGVLGHETAHITARHSAHQLSQQQLAQIAVIGTAIVKPELAQFANLASQGLGLLFLKYGRDDEREADAIGFRYMVAEGYDPREMAETFRTLDRVSGTSSEGRPPEWLSTHPDPGNRVEDALARVRALNRDLSGTIVRRDEYLRHLDGLVYGVNPRDGYFDGATFYHPDLRFQLQFPSGWKVQNQTAAVVGLSAQQDAIVQLSLAPEGTPSQLLQQFIGQQGIQSGQASTASINGFTAASAAFVANTEQGQIGGVMAFLADGGTTYQLLGYTSAQQRSEYDPMFRQWINSYRRLTDSRALGVQPAKLSLVKVPSSMSLGEFNRRYPSTIPLSELAMINGVAESATLTAGTTVKRVQGGR